MPGLDPTFERTPRCPLCADLRTGVFAVAEGRVYHRCAGCLLTFLAPAARPSRAIELATYGQHRNDPGDPRYRAFLARLLDPLLHHLRPGMIGLDFGCGPGPAIRPMLARHRIEMIDYDPLFRPDPAALARRYDFITCSEAIEHFFDAGRELIRLDALLRPGGWLGVMTRMLTDDAGFAHWWYRRDPTHVAFFRRETMVWIARHFRWHASFPEPTVALFHKPGAARQA